MSRIASRALNPPLARPTFTNSRTRAKVAGAKRKVEEHWRKSVTNPRNQQGKREKPANIGESPYRGSTLTLPPFVGLLAWAEEGAGEKNRARTKVVLVKVVS